MKQTLSLFFFALFFATVSRAVQVGASQAEVTAAWGQPMAVRTKASGGQVWKMKDGTTVWVTQGVVSQIAAPLEDSSRVKESGPVEPVVEVEKAAGTDAVTDFPFNIGHLLLGVGLVVVAVTKFQYCQQVFKGRGWQLVGCFIPFVSFAFVFSHWRQTKKLFAWQMFVALPLLMVGFHLVPTSPVKERAGHGRAASTHSPAQPRAAVR